jgi:mono/diheme cytochrome c family protein
MMRLEQEEHFVMNRHLTNSPILFGALLSGAVILASASLVYAQAPMHSAWSGVYSSAQADKGKALFGENCAKCHGGTLDGNDEIPPLKGAHFMADWETQSVAELIARVHTTMPMDNPGKLNTESSTAVVAYLLQQNGMPAGSAPLTDGTAAQSRIDAVKPGGDTMATPVATTAKPAATTSATGKPAATATTAAAMPVKTAATPKAKVTKTSMKAKPKPPAN